MSMITGTLLGVYDANDESKIVGFQLNGLIAVWQLQAADSLIPTMLLLINKIVDIQGEQTATLPYGGVFRVDAISERTVAK